MATNKLMEAAADILAGSKSKSGADPMQKMSGQDYEDLGGPTPQNSKPDDDSNKIHASGKAPDHSAKNKASISAKPSAASPDTQNSMKKEEVTFAEDVDALFADDSTISEEFKSKVSTIFEARVNDRISQIAEETEARYADMLEEAVEAVKIDLTEKVNDYLSYVVEQWIADNEIAIETGLRSELTEDFISGLRNLFAEHYIDVPAEKVDLVEELATKVEELESQLNEEIERGIETKKSLVESLKQEITREVSEGLTATQVEKIKSLAESVEFSTEEEYTTKLETIRENYFPSGVKKADEEQLHEEVNIAEDKKQVINDPYIAAAMAAITKSVK
jgi:hypothetical protein